MPLLRKKRARRVASRISSVAATRRAENFAVEPLEDRHMLTLLGVSPEFPQIQYDSNGVTNYTAASQSLNINATPLTFQLSAIDPFRTITNTPFPSFEIHIKVDNSGNLIGGVPGDDLRVYGDIDIDGDSIVDVSGTLLTGEILQFGYQEAGPNVDFFDFRFKVTGGMLTQGPYAAYFAGKDVAVFQRLEARVGFPSFNNSFETDFTPMQRAFWGPPTH